MRVAPAVFLLALLPAALSAQPELHTGAAVGLHVGSPAIVSLALGGYHDLTRASSDGAAPAVFALVEPGVRAGRLSVGIVHMAGNFGTGWSIRGTALRSWQRDVGTYVGAEVSAMVLGLGPRVGVFRQVAPSGTASTRVTADFGFGI